MPRSLAERIVELDPLSGASELCLFLQQISLPAVESSGTKIAVTVTYSLRLGVSLPCQMAMLFY